MAKRGGFREIMTVAVRFFAFAPPLLAVWWLVLPVYAYAIAFAARLVLEYALNVPIDSFRVFNTGLLSDSGFLNTGTQLSFVVKGVARTFDKVAYLTTNVAPFAALVLATPGLGARRKGRIIAAGTAILAATHVAFIATAFTIGRNEITWALGEAFITLPLLLWIVLAYWEHLAGYFAELSGPGKKTSP